MPARFDHTIVWSRDAAAAAAFLAEVLGLPAPGRVAHFHVLRLANGAQLDYADAAPPIAAHHYAFLVDEHEFDAAFERLAARGVPYYADPARRRAGEVDRSDGGRRIYFEDPTGHVLEIQTQRCDADG